MDRGCVRRPRLRSRLMIALTITGLALVAMLPTVRSAPGLSRTPRRIEAPALLAFGPTDGSDSDQAESDSRPVLVFPEESPGDTDDRADEVPDSIEWMAVRSSKAQCPTRSSTCRWAEPVMVRPVSIRADRRSWLPFATVKPGLGLSVGLCRLLL